MPNTTIEYQRPLACPTCCSNLIHGHGKKSKTVVHLHFMRHGIKRWIVRHATRRYKCLSCGSTFYPPYHFGSTNKYGQNLVAYSIYLNIGLRMSQERV